jgi:hypothetical protein
MLKKLYYYYIALILFSGCISETSKEKKVPDVVTFSEHIAPIIHKNCTPCHRKGEAGPFELLTYKEVHRKANMIALVTEKKIMPPWPADRTYTNFANERGLSEYEIKLISKWIDDGILEGEPLTESSYPIFPKGSQFGKPDLVIKMPDSILIKGNNTDHFIITKIPFQLPEKKYVRLIEFVPGNRQLVHHVNSHLISYENNKKQNVATKQGYINTNESNYTVTELFEKLGLPNDDGSYPLLTSSISNYLPGVVPAEYPQNIGGYIFPEKGAIFLNDIHYGPSAKDRYDQSYFNIFFTDKKPERPLKEFQMGTIGISKIEPELVIPPNKISTYQTKYTLSEDISLLTINPHMHLLGKKFWAFAINPEGDTIPLIKINDWDFRWQYFYTFKKIIKLSKGTNFYAIGTFDNTINNLNNPYNPPRYISERDGSMRTTDEMFQLIVMYVPYKEGDENISLE